MSDLLEYVAVAAGLEFDWAVAADAIGNGHSNKSLNQTGVRTPNSLWRSLE
jgi:hypothetical protein